MRGLLPWRGVGGTGHLGHDWAHGWCSLFLLKHTALVCDGGEQDQPKQLDTAVTPFAPLYEAATMTVALMAAWLHVGGIHVYTQHGRAAL